MKINKKESKAIVSALSSGAIYGANSPSIKKFSGKVDTAYNRSTGIEKFTKGFSGNVFVTAFRELAALIMIFIVVLFKKATFNPVRLLKESKAARVIAISALLGGPLAALLRVMAINYAGSGLSGTFTGMWIVFIPVFGTLFFKKKYTMTAWWGVIITSIAGSLSYLIFGISATSTFTLGILLALIVAVLWAIQHILVENAMKGVSKNDSLSSEQANIYRYGISTIVYIVLIIPISMIVSGTYNPFTLFTEVFFGEGSLTVWGWYVVMMVSAGTANLLLYYSIKIIGSAWSSVLQNSYVVFGVLFTMLFNIDKDIAGENGQYINDFFGLSMDPAAIYWIMNIMLSLIVMVGMTLVTMGSYSKGKNNIKK